MSSECRICFSDDRPLISPCGCRGSMAFVHETCLHRWFKASIRRREGENFHCELCKQILAAKIEFPSWFTLFKKFFSNIFRDKGTTIKTCLYLFYLYLFGKRVCSVIQLMYSFVYRKCNSKTASILSFIYHSALLAQLVYIFSLEIKRMGRFFKQLKLRYYKVKFVNRGDYDIFALTSLVYINILILGDINVYQKCHEPLHIWILVSFYFLICERFAMNYYAFLKKYISIFTYLLFFVILTGHALWTVLGTIWYFNEREGLAECLGENLGRSWKMNALLGLNYAFLIGVVSFLIVRAYLIHRFGYDDFPIIEDGFIDTAQSLTDDELKRIPLRRMDCLNNVRDAECTICFGNIKPDEFARQMPQCNHVFHNKCIISWLKIKGFCPNCKGNVKQIVQ